jgi:lipopolysaccharide/colanic/teichoic acid biosynthesis glycosyltransferase
MSLEDKSVNDDSFDSVFGDEVMETVQQEPASTVGVSSPLMQKPALVRRYRAVLSSMKVLAWKMVVASRDPVKRVFDIIGAIVLLILTSPLFLIISIAIKLYDGGPVIFTQTRIGKWGKPFRFYKFRSMVVNAEDLKSKLMQYNEMKGVTFKMKNDPRVTPVGRIIRRLSFDELPQLWCVLKGDMSLVGPRPPLPSEVALYNNRHHYRLDGMPGLTCLWQVKGRNEIQFEDQVRLDVEYLHKRSLKEDILLLLQTVKAVITGRGAS